MSYTSIAASTTLVTISPVWVALLSWRWFGEKPAWLTLLGIGIALAGSFLIGLGDASLISGGTNPLLGDLLALVGSLAASLYFLWGREAQRQGMGIGSYATVAYSVAAIALLPLPVLTQTSYIGYSATTYGYMVLMALLPQLIGHTSLNWSIRWCPHACYPSHIVRANWFKPFRMLDIWRITQSTRFSWRYCAVAWSSDRGVKTKLRTQNVTHRSAHSSL